MPLVSVICFCFNARTTIRRCLDSILAQDYPRVEIVVQDGASTDGTLEILQTYGEAIKLVSTPDKGPGYALFAAIERAQGEILGSCLADEELLPHAVTWGVRQLGRHPDAAAVYGDHYITDIDGRITGLVRPGPWDFDQVLFSRFIPPFCASFFRRSSFDEAGLRAYNDCGEFEIWIRLGAKFPIVYQPGLVSKYAVHPEELSNQPGHIERQAMGKRWVLERFFQDPSSGPLPDHKRREALCGLQVWLTVSYCNAGHWEPALDAFFKAYAQDPDSEQLPGAAMRLLNHGLSRLRQGKQDQAQAYLQLPSRAPNAFKGFDLGKLESLRAGIDGRKTIQGMTGETSETTWSGTGEKKATRPFKDTPVQTDGLDRLIPPEIKNDAFYADIQHLAAEKGLRHILEIGSSSGAGSTSAFVAGILQGGGQATLHCMEISRTRFEKLQASYQNTKQVICHQTSSVPLDGFPSEDEIKKFYRQTDTALNHYPLERVLGWLRQDKDYVQRTGICQNGIERIKQAYGIETFDLVLIDGSEFTGRAELDQVYGARIILLDDINSYKNHHNYHKLKQDPAYCLEKENWRLRNGYAVFRRVDPCETLPVHFFTIVLNGMPFMPCHIEVMEQLDYPWHWHIVEGVADHTHDTAWGKANGGRIPDEFHLGGLSVDGTREYLDQLAVSHPDRVTVYRPPAGAFWDGKRAMVRAPLARLPDACLLWQLDADELWTRQQIQRMHSMFSAEPQRTAAFFHCHFFVGPNLVTTTPDAWSHHNRYEWLRVWRYRKGMRWESHEPPSLVQPDGAGLKDVARIHPFSQAETEQAGLVFTHYAYVLESQVRFKERYYGYTGAVEQWRRLQKAEQWPVDLKAYLAWVRDHAEADLVENRTIGRTVSPVPFDFTARRPKEPSPPRVRIVIDGVIFQLQHQRPLGIARVWKNLFKVLAETLEPSGSRPDITVLERRGFPVPWTDSQPVQVAPLVLGGEDDLDRDDEQLSAVCTRLKADLFLSTYYTRAPGVRNLVLVHDMIPELMQADLGHVEWRAKTRVLETADAYACVSRSTRQDLLQFHPHARMKPCAVIHNGVDPVFQPSTARAMAAFRQSHGIKGDYVLWVGNRRGYKNSRTLLGLAAGPAWPGTLTLIMTGGEKNLSAIEKGLILDKRLKVIDFLSNEELAAAYSGACALVYLSHYEGFGLPVAEAMACGCPVIATAKGAIPEVGGDAVRYVASDKVQHLADAIKDACDPHRRMTRRKKGLQQVKAFTWRRTATGLHTLIAEICSRTPPRITAVVSAYNSESYIAGCLEDLEAQTCVDQLEIIVVDSASPQKESVLVREFQQRFPNIKYLRTPQRETVYQAWNRGIKLALGTYITNANTDDRHRHDAFERMVRVLDEDEQAALVYADVIRTNRENQTFGNCTPTGVLRWYPWQRSTLLEKGCFIGPQPMWRRTLHGLFGYFDEQLSVAADYDFWLRASQVYDFRHINIPLGLYLERSDSVEHCDHHEKRRQDDLVNRRFRKSLAENRIIGFQPFEDLRKAFQIKDTRSALCALQRISRTCRERWGDKARSLLVDIHTLAETIEKGRACREKIEEIIQLVGAAFLHRQPYPARQKEQPVHPSRQGEHRIETNVRFAESPQGGANMQLADEIHEGIQCLLKAGHERAASWMLEKALADFPSNARWHYEKAMLAYQKNNSAAALGHFRRAAELEPHNSVYQKSLGDCYHVSNGQIDLALEQYSKALSLNPRDLETLLTAANLSVTQRDIEQACAYFEQALDIDPGHADARRMLEQLRVHHAELAKPVHDPGELYAEAQAANEQDDTSQAMQLLRNVLEQDPDSGQAHNDLAVLLYNQGDKEAALRHYSEAARLEPENAVYLKNLADFLYIERGEIQKALEKYVQALTLDPEDCEALLATGHICLHLGQKEDAAIFIERVLTIDPWNGDARKLLNQCNPDPSYSISAQDDEALYARAQEEVAAGRRGEAVDALKNLIAQSPDYALAFNDLGVLSYEAGDKQAALGFYEQAVRLEPDNPTFLKNLADFYFVEQQRTEDALKIYVRLLETDREDLDCLMAAGAICASLEQVADARVFFQRVLEIDPWNRQAGDALEQLERRGQHQSVGEGGPALKANRNLTL